MKIVLAFLSITMTLAMAGCTAQKTSLSEAQKTESKILHQQALQALEDRNFIIKTDEFYLSGKDPVVSRDSYISMRGKQGVIRYSPELFPQTDYDCLNIEDAAAELTLVKTRKNGDKEFRLKIEAEPKYWLNGDLTFTLYDNTNRCSVRVNTGTRLIRYTGNIYSLSE